jgi:RimJ/RimL family protein N-acetyltransferase
LEDTVELRLLTPTDLPAYKALRDEALARHADAFNSDFATEKLRDAQSYAKRLGTPAQGHFTLGAFSKATGALLGTVALERQDKLKNQHVADVVGMMVQSDAQRRGVGRALITECVRLAKTCEGLRLLKLTVTASNTHVVNLYEQAGFVPMGLLPGAIRVDGEYLDKLYMYLKLT